MRGRRCNGGAACIRHCENGKAQSAKIPEPEDLHAAWRQSDGNQMCPVIVCFLLSSGRGNLSAAFLLPFSVPDLNHDELPYYFKERKA